KDNMARQRLKEAAEKAKMELSTLLETDINLPFVTADATGPKHLLMKLTRSRYEQMCEDIFQRSVGPCKQAMKDANVTPDKIDEVVLVGGSTRIPRIQTIVKELFNKEPNKSVNPDEVVAVGAAVQGGVLGGFSLIRIPPAPRGVPQIEVTFDIDANGILNVVAKDKATNNEQKITITSSSGLSKEEVDKMARDAESHAADDRKSKDQIEARNRADAMVYNVEKTLKEHRDKISADDAKT